jgi:tetratricopeptide (TPR) repeat protein
MPGGGNDQLYTRKEVERLLGFSEQQLRRWERQELVPHLEQFGFADLVALRSLQKLRQSKVPAVRIRRAVAALREKLKDVTDPLRELKIVCEGRNVAVLLDGRKMEPVSGQLLLNFDRAELNSLLSFPREKEKAAPAARQQEAEDWFEKGLELERTGAPLEDIIKAYERAIELDPHSAGAYVNLGTIYYHLKSWAKAESCYLSALEADPNYALAHFNLGNLFDEKGDRERALAHYHAAIQANPSYADAHYNLALLYQTRGDVLKAVRYWKSYLKLDGGSSWSAIARRELDKLRRETVVPGRENGT